MGDSYYNIPRVALIGTANVFQSVTFIAEHKRGTLIKNNLQNARSVFLNILGDDSLAEKIFVMIFVRV